MTGLAQGVYSVTATRTAGTGTVTANDITVGLNQEVSTQLVLTQPVANVAGSVVTQLVSGGSTPVETATVTVTGTTGFSGLTPMRSTGTPPAVTNGSGAFTVCTVQAGCPAGTGTYLPLVTARVDVQVTADGYEPYSATDVPTSALAAITLNPTGVAFTGRVQLDPAAVDAAELADAMAKVRFDVLSAPPGVGQLSLTGRADGTVVWSDSSQPTNPAGGRLIRPGTYELVASLPGYDNASVTVVVDPGEAMPEAVFTLKRFGFLRISAVAEQDSSVPVLGTIMTLSLPGGVTQRIEAHPGDSFVDFGDLPTGTYSVDVRAPNYARVTAQVQVTAGQTTSAPSPVTLRRLGAISGVVQSRLAVGWTEALPDAQVTVSRQGVSFTATTTTDGSYRVTGTTVTDGLVGGTWNVTATAPGHTAGTAVSGTIPNPATSTVADLDQGVDPVELTAQHGELQVFAMDGTTGVPDLTMQISYRDSLRTEERTPTCVPGQTGGGCPGTAGLYIFRDVLPLTYNLNISGGSYSPLTLPVTVGAGKTVVINVPITTPAGSVQGLVQHQTANGGTVPVEGAVVTLTPTTGTARTATSDVNGQYAFTTVAPGTYTLSTTSGGLSTSRTVTVQPAQGLVVDLVLTDVTRQVRVTVTSANDTDLTGALVALSGGSSPPAAQPAVRTAAGASTYATTFNQVTAGTWSITVSGPSGHLGSHSGSVVVPATGTGVVAGAVTVTETQLALRATTAVPGAPSTVAATVTQGGTATPVTVAVGGGDTVLFLPATGATVAASVTGTWTVTVTGGTVPSGAAFALATMDVVGRATTTSATGGGGTVLTGDDVSLTTRVQASGADPTAGTLQMQRRTSTSPDVWADVGSGITATGANQTITATVDAGWGTGSVTLRVAYSGSGAWAPSVSGTVTVTVQTPTTTTAAWTASPGTITATVSPSAATGTVTFQTVAGGGGGTNIAGCVNVTVSAGVATCTYAPASGTTNVRAVFTGTGVYAPSTSATTTAG